MHKLILIRHGDALHPATAMVQGMADPERPLTELGGSQVRAAGAAMAREFSHKAPVYIVASPFCRAQQTASLVYETLKAYQFEVIAIPQEPSLEPDEDPSSAASVLTDLLLNQQIAQLVAVSHLPLIESLYLELCAQYPPAQKEHSSFTTAAWKTIYVPLP
jgi:phosphohistidine phosphatase SixA